MVWMPKKEVHQLPAFDPQHTQEAVFCVSSNTPCLAGLSFGKQTVCGRKGPRLLAVSWQVWLQVPFALLMGFSLSYWQSEGYRQLAEWEESQDHRILRLGRNSRACHPDSNHLVLGSEEVSKQRQSYPPIHFATLVGWWRPLNVNEAILNRIQRLPKGSYQSPDARGIPGTKGPPASWWMRVDWSLPLLQQGCLYLK